MNIIEMNKKIGLVVMFDISSAGGAPKVLVDFIDTLNIMGKEVYLLTPFKLDYKKIENLYGKIKIKKVYYPGKLKSLICQGNFLPRRFMKKEFLEMTKEVDMIIDIDGGIVHNHLPKDFDKSKYIIWRFSCIGLKRHWIKNGPFRNAKEFFKILLGSKKCIPSKDHKIYAVDKLTKEELKLWNLNCEEICLYPQIKLDKFIDEKINKKKQIAVFGRITPNKLIEDSIKIYAIGTKNFPEYNLVIFGGRTSDTKSYKKKLNNLIKELGISNRVKIVESPLFEEVKKLLFESSILIDSQKKISMTLSSVEALATGCIILAQKESGTYMEVLDNGKYGYGFDNVQEGGEKLEKIISDLEKGKLNRNKFSKRAEYFSEENFIKRLKEIIK
jgi:glycosyltransferase involved in cell wall biosynthesis